MADCLDELKNSSRVILTPNHREFKRLYVRVFGDQEIDEITEDHVKSLSHRLGVNVFCKGSKDIISNGNEGMIYRLI